MGRQIDYGEAKVILADTFTHAELAFLEKSGFAVSEQVEHATAVLFASNTQAFREALIGCAVARILDPEIDIHLPYMNQGENAFNGRTLDETVVNPFLQERGIPCSKGPYLSALRRNISFVADTAKGLRDKEAFNALLTLIDILSDMDIGNAHNLLASILFNFVALRDRANINLRKVARLSLVQYGSLIDGLLATPSGGLMPVLLTVAMFQTLKDCYGLDWEIEWQGINVADAASGAGGDITVSRKGTIALTIEVTERPISRERVVSTFNTKVSENGLDDYLFFHSAAQPTAEAREQARQYFAQGHDINFVAIREWVLTAMTTIGPKCRAMFTANAVGLLGAKGIPAAMRQAWNDQIAAVAGNSN